MNPRWLSIDDMQRKPRPDILTLGNQVAVSARLSLLGLLSKPTYIEGTAVFVCLGGTIEGTINNQPYRIEKNTVLIVFSGDLVKIDRTADLEGYGAMMSNDFLDELDISFAQRAAFFANMRANSLSHVGDEVIEQFRPFYHLVLQILRSDASEKEEIVKGLVYAYCHRIFALGRSQASSGKKLMLTRNQEIFHNFITLVVKHSSQEHSVAFYAQEMGLSPKYLSYAVKTFSQRGALDWINEHVMLQARFMLRSTDMTVKEIAFALNFPTQSAFGKFFRQKQGVGPKEYRYNS